MTNITVVRFLKFLQKVQKAQLILLMSFKTETRDDRTQKILPQFWLLLATVIFKLLPASTGRDAIAASLVTR
ncbi:MAG TPA: hypothetical protein DEV81_20540 [Cyanobacteria bacterium UBA11049]|nr:hypothetical protein [Cyanobacteria bacterium UBA11049]